MSTTDVFYINVPVRFDRHGAVDPGELEAGSPSSLSKTVIDRPWASATACTTSPRLVPSSVD